MKLGKKGDATFSFLRSRERRRNPQEKKSHLFGKPRVKSRRIDQAARPSLEVVTLSMPRRCVELRCYVYMVCKPLLMMGEKEGREREKFAAEENIS